MVRCLELEARFIEIDVQLTRDRQVILHHDRTLQRCCGVDGAVHDYTLAELQRMSFSEPDFFKEQFQGLPPATLGEVSTLCRTRPGLTLFIEVKSVSVERFGVQTVLNAVNEAVCRPGPDEILIGYRPDLLEAAHPVGWSRTGLILRDWEQAGSRQAAVHEYLFCNVSRLPTDRFLGSAGSKLGVYDVIDRQVAAALLERGVDLVETFDLPGMLGQES
jgi:glycerophosphoryl diester phosphodiesterase